MPGDIHEERARSAASSHDAEQRTPPPLAEDERDDEEEADVVQRAARVRRRRDMLRQEVEIEALEQQLATLRRSHNAGVTPAASGIGDDDDEDAASQALSVRSTHSRRGLANRPRLKEPESFKGKTLKEARDFIRSLELVFALAPDAYQSDRERVLYGVMFIAGEPRETWHHNNSVDRLDDYVWDDFKKFVLDAVEDPVNRSLSTTVAYETARQGDGQTVQAFATELATLEEQMDPYTADQRTRHLLAKLKPALRTAIITYHEVPKRREDLVSLATRLESASKRSDVALAPHKRAAEDQKNRWNGSKKRRGSPQRQKDNREPQSKRKESAGGSSGNSVVCWGCNELGHYRTDCPKGNGDKASTRKVGASAEKAKGKAADNADKPA
jgi:hypothetical protein